jgi:2-methylisocitrate lyase-like PEP mutase family enzyme
MVTLREMVDHVAALAGSIDVPLNADSEHLFAQEVDGIADSIALLVRAGAAGCSIEDYNPRTGAVESIDSATERVAAAAAACRDQLVLTARAENHLYGRDDLADTIARLSAYRDAGADCVYAPGLTSLEDIRAVVEAVEIPVNVLTMPGGASIAELEEAGVRRVSTGGLLAWAAYGALATAARELLEHGTSTYTSAGLSLSDRARAFNRGYTSRHATER